MGGAAGRSVVEDVFVWGKGNAVDCFASSELVRRRIEGVYMYPGVEACMDSVDKLFLINLYLECLTFSKCASFTLAACGYGCVAGVLATQTYVRRLKWVPDHCSFRWHAITD